MNNPFSADTAQKRLDEFTWYHLHGDGDCNGQVLRAYAISHALDPQSCFDLAYFYSVTYCCMSAVYLLNHRQDIHAAPSAYATRIKPLLIFQSDRKYVRMRDCFERILCEWDALHSKGYHRFYKAAHDSVQLVNTVRALAEIQSWYYFGRYASYLFLETYCDIFSLAATRADGLQYEGDQMTFAGGLYRAFARDTEAEFVDKNKRLPTSTKQFEKLLHELQTHIRDSGGDDSLVKLETSLCAYDKFFKGTRYNGFYADRQLAELEAGKSIPQFTETVTALFEARSEAIDDMYLGENHGWHGIQTHLKKYYLQTGHIVGRAG